MVTSPFPGVAVTLTGAEGAFDDCGTFSPPHLPQPRNMTMPPNRAADTRKFFMVLLPEMSINISFVSDMNRTG
jgi:hypothetical protein